MFQLSRNGNDIVVDIFNGSGTLGVAAVRHGRRYIGIDNNVEYLNLTIKRLVFEKGEQ